MKLQHGLSCADERILRRWIAEELERDAAPADRSREAGETREAGLDPKDESAGRSGSEGIAQRSPQ